MGQWWMREAARARTPRLAMTHILTLVASPLANPIAGIASDRADEYASIRRVLVRDEIAGRKRSARSNRSLIGILKMSSLEITNSTEQIARRLLPTGLGHQRNRHPASRMKRYTSRYPSRLSLIYSTRIRRLKSPSRGNICCFFFPFLSSRTGENIGTYI